MKDEQEYIVVRERTHRNTAESTNDRVKWWSILQALGYLSKSDYELGDVGDYGDFLSQRLIGLGYPRIPPIKPLKCRGNVTQGE